MAAGSPFGSWCSADSELRVHRTQLIAIWTSFFVVTGATYQAPPLLLPSLMKEFGVSQYSISWLPAAFEVGKGLFAMPGGFAIDAFGSKRTFRAGSIIVLTCSLCYPFARHLWFLILLHALYGVAYNLCGVAPILVLATSWFQEQRATAIGIILTGFSMAGVIFNPLVAELVERCGWRCAAGLSFCVLLVVLIPLAFCVLREGPLLSQQKVAGSQQSSSTTEPPSVLIGDSSPAQGAHQEYNDDDRLRFTGDAPSPRDRVGQCARVECSAAVLPSSFRHSLGYSAVWHLACMSMYVLYVVITLINELTLYLNTDVGLSLKTCGLYSSIVFQCSILGKLLVGFAFDSRARHCVGTASFLCLVCGTLLLFKPGTVQLTTSQVQLFAFAVVYGLGYGTCFCIVSSMPAKMFGGMPEFGKLQSFLVLFQVIGGFCGTLITTKLRVLTGSYELSFCMFVVLGMLAGLHYLALEYRSGAVGRHYGGE